MLELRKTKGRSKKVDDMTNKQDSKSIESSDSDELVDDELETVAGGAGVVGAIESPRDPASVEAAKAGTVHTHDIVIVKVVDKSSPKLS